MLTEAAGAESDEDVEGRAFNWMLGFCHLITDCGTNPGSRQSIGEGMVSVSSCLDRMGTCSGNGGVCQCQRQLPLARRTLGSSSTRPGVHVHSSELLAKIHLDGFYLASSAYRQCTCKPENPDKDSHDYENCINHAVPQEFPVE